jgi:hypothetical protein
MKYKISRLLKLLFSGSFHLHSSQYGEDVYLHKKFRKYSGNGFYIDIGAHHPFQISNTSYLWALGWNGVNVDAGLATIEKFKQLRPEDENICAAVVSEIYADSNNEIKFYFSNEIDNCATCDPQIAQERGLTKNESVKCLSLTKIIELGCSKFNGEFTFLNIDIEGLDEEVIGNIKNWMKKPLVLMIEMYGESIREVMDRTAFQQLENEGYVFIQRVGHTAIFELS